ENGVNQLQQSDLQSPESFHLPYAQQVDLAVVTSGQDTMVVPIEDQIALADNRINQDLSNSRQIYAVLDKPSYSAGDTVKFAGFDQLDNDAQYSPDQGSLSLFVAASDDPTTPLQNITVALGPGG